MNNALNVPNENIASEIVNSMTAEKVLSVIRLTTGDQYFVYAVKTDSTEYVIRITDISNKDKFISAIYWQEKLIPLGIPLAKFINSDLENKYSQFLSLLMMRFPGDDLCNVYPNLTNADKKNLAGQIVKIQSATEVLPKGLGYGIANTYEQVPEDKSWYDFLIKKLTTFSEIIKQNNIFDADNALKAIHIANEMESELSMISARPFLWDVSERNVIVHQGKISGIVDVDDMCFGDPLFVLGLTYTALENDGHDVVYTDYWAEALQLNQGAQLRLNFYRLFFSIVFMRKHSMFTTNQQKIMFNVSRLQKIFQQSLARIYA